MRTRLLLWAIALTLAGLPGCRHDADASLPSEYAQMTIPAAFDSAAARTRGAATFREQCALCHGETGDGHGPRREGLTSSPRDFTDPQWRQSTTPRRIFFVIREGLAPAAMPSWKTLSDDQLWDLTAYVWSLGEPR